ncbi:MAG: hypothetical protein A2018_02265 [Alphaproteobacteria bacterium GWF2_58_20]|nr:MAG: hypothetical protein A2018_02265 [Alphaproteobacteria bacterium GWF2_58_20]
MIKSLTNMDRKLFAAIRNQDVDGACSALANGANPNAQMDLGKKEFISPLGYALMHDNTAIWNILLQHPYLDINHSISMGRPALHWMAHIGDLEMVKTLIERGANVNKLAENGTLALGYAIGHYHIGVITCLLENGANPNAAQTPFRDMGLGETLMHMTARSGCHTNCLGLMIRHGGNPHTPDANGITPLDIVKKRAQHIMELRAQCRPKP